MEQGVEQVGGTGWGRWVEQVGGAGGGADGWGRWVGQGCYSLCSQLQMCSAHPLVSPPLQQFGIQLASQVLAHYPLPSATDTAQLLLKKLHTLLAEVPRQAHTDLFIPVLPFLVTLCQSFPPLSEETTRFLLKLGRQHLLAPSQPPGQGERAADKQGIKEFLSSVEGGGEERGQPQEQHLMLLAVQQTFKQLAEKAIIKF